MKKIGVMLVMFLLISSIFVVAQNEEVEDECSGFFGAIKCFFFGDTSARKALTGDAGWFQGRENIYGMGTAMPVPSDLGNTDKWRKVKENNDFVRYERVDGSRIFLQSKQKTTHGFSYTRVENANVNIGEISYPVYTQQLPSGSSNVFMTPNGVILESSNREYVTRSSGVMSDSGLQQTYQAPPPPPATEPAPTAVPAPVGGAPATPPAEPAPTPPAEPAPAAPAPLTFDAGSHKIKQSDTDIATVPAYLTEDNINLGLIITQQEADIFNPRRIPLGGRGLFGSGFLDPVTGEIYASNTAEDPPIMTITQVGEGNVFVVEREETGFNTVFFSDRSGKPLSPNIDSESYGDLLENYKKEPQLVLDALQGARMIGISVEELANKLTDESDIRVTVTRTNGIINQITLTRDNLGADEQIVYDKDGLIQSYTLGKLKDGRVEGQAATFTYTEDRKPNQMSLEIIPGNNIQINLKAESEGATDGYYKVSFTEGYSLPGYNNNNIYWQDGTLYYLEGETLREIPADHIPSPLQEALKNSDEIREKWSEESYGTYTFGESWQFGQEKFYGGWSSLVQALSGTEFDIYGSGFLGALFGTESYSEYVQMVDQSLGRYFNMENYVADACKLWWPQEADIATEGVAAIETTAGTYQYVAHLEGERSRDKVIITCHEEDPCREGQECRDGICVKEGEPVYGWFYKISWTVKAPEDVTFTPFIDENGYAVKYNIGLFKEFERNNDGSRPDLWLAPADAPGDENTLQLANGRMDPNVYVDYSDVYYEQVCLKWGAPPKTREPILGEGVSYVGPLCPEIKESNRGMVNWQASGRQTIPSVTAGEVGLKNI